MPEREHQVIYRAVADFSSLIREARKAKREIAALKAAEASIGSDSAANQAKTTAARISSSRAAQSAAGSLGKLADATERVQSAETKLSKSSQESAKALGELNREARSGTEALQKEGAALEKAAVSSEKLAKSTSSLPGHFTRISAALSKKAQAAKDDEDASDKASRAARKLGEESSASGRAVSEMTRSLASLSTGARKAASDVDALGNSARRAGSGGGGSGLRRLAGDANAAFSSMSKLGKISLLATIFGAIGAAIAPLISALGALIPLALSAANALGSLVGAAGAVGPGLAAAVTGVGALIVAFRGVGLTLKAYAAAQKSAAKAGSNSANQAVDQARRIQDAQDRLTDARIAQTRAAEDSARRIQDAEENLTRSLRNTRKAQEDLNKAREEALKDLIDLREEVARGSLDEEGARARLLKAQEDYMRALADPDKTAADRAEALYELHKAEQDLKDVQEKRVKDQKALVKAEKDGVEGSEKVVTARENLRDATERQGDAARDLKRALEDQKRSQYDTAKAVQRAIEDLAQARKKDAQSATAAETAENLYKEQLDKLSPSAKKVTLALIGMQGAWENLQRNVQEAFFSHIVGDLGRIKGLLPVVDDLLTRAADSLGKVADKGIRMVSSGPWTRDFGALAKSNQTLIENIGDAVLQVSDAFRSITVGAIPIAEQFSADIKELSTNFNNFIQNSRDNGSLGTFFEKSYERLKQFGRILENVAIAFGNLILASSDFTDDLLDSIEEASGKFRDFSEDQKKAGSPFKKYLEDVKPLLRAIASLVGAVAKAFLEMATDPKNIQRAVDLLEKLEKSVLPAIVRLLDDLSNSGIDEAVLDAFVAILNALSSFLENGGGGGIAAFASVLGGIAKGIGAIVSIPGVGSTLGAIATALGAIAALSFVAKASGLLSLAKVIGNIAKSEGPISRLFKILAGGAAGVGALGGRGRGKDGKSGRGGTSGAGGALDDIINASLGRDPVTAADKDKERKKDKKKVRRTRGGRGRGIGGAVASAVGDAAISEGLDAIINRSRGKGGASALKGASKGGTSFLGVLGRNGSKVGGLAARNVGTLGKVGKFAKFAGGPISLLAGIGGSVAASLIGNGAGGRRDTLSGAINGGLSGAALGGLIGSVVPVLGTGIGAAIGGTIGAGLGAIDGAGGLSKLGDQIKSTLTDIGTAFSGFGDGVKGVYTRVEGATDSFWSSIGSFFMNGWRNADRFNRQGWAAITNFFTSSWDFLKRQAQGAWAAITGFFVSAWNSIKTVTLGGWSAITSFFTTSWERLKGIVSGGWSALKNFFSSGFSSIQSLVIGGWTNVRKAFDSALGGLKGAVTGALDSIAAQWNRLKTDLKSPVEFFVNTVIGGGVVGNVNKLLDFLNLPLLPVPSIAFATGGRVPGTGNKDSVPAMLMPGEFVIRKSAVQEIGVENLERMNNGKNSHRKDGAGWAIPRFAKGGLVPSPDDIWSGAKSFFGDIKDGGKALLGEAKSSTEDLLKGGVASSLNTALKPIRALLDQLGEDGIGGLFRGVGNYTIDQIIGAVGGMSEAPTSGGPVAAAPTNVSGNKAIVKNLAASMYGWVGAEWDALYNLLMGESGFRNNAQNPTSTAYGIFQFLDSTWDYVGARKTSDPRLQTIAGLKYIAKSYGDPIRAYAKWRSRSPHWYGAGGPVASASSPLASSAASSLAKLSSSWPMTPKSAAYGSAMSDRLTFAPGLGADALVAMASGGLVPSFQGTYATVPASALAGASQSIANTYSTDRGFTVENLNIHNPRPEKSGDSLYRTVEKLTFFGGARG